MRAVSALDERENVSESQLGGRTTKQRIEHSVPRSVTRRSLSAKNT
jgi:hypothetical protein